MKRGSILAHSGHASVVFDWYSTRDFGNSKKTLQTIVTGADSGGHSGIIRGLTDHLWSLPDFRELYSLIELDEISIPLGDLRNQISRWSELYGRLFSRRLEDGRFEKGAISLFTSLVSDPENHIEKAGIGETLFHSYFGRKEYDLDELNYVLENRFEKYISLFKKASSDRYAEDNKFQNIKHAIGNIILHFLYIECAQAFKKNHIRVGVDLELSEDFQQSKVSTQELFFGLLRNLNLIPSNLWLRVLREKGSHLQAITTKGEYVNGENAIDELTSAKLLSESFKLFLDEDFSKEITEEASVTELFKSIEETTDYWIIPPGSVSNWMPIINQFPETLKRNNKPIYMFVNSFVQKCEPDLITQISHVVSTVGPIQLIAPEINPAQVEGYDEFFKSSYKAQFKSPVDFNELEKEIKNRNLDVNIHRILNWRTFAPGEKGLKYSEYEVSLMLSVIGEYLEHGEKIDIDQILKANGLMPSETLVENINKFLESNKSFLETHHGN
jgi:hypothetical protein